MATSPILGEFMGTLVMIFLGNGVVANMLLSQTKGHGGGILVINAAWGLAVMVGVFVAQKFGSADAHLNPALSIAFAIQSGNYLNLLPFILAQMAGAFCGAVLVWLFYYPHFGLTDDKDAKLAVFCNSPAIKHLPSNFFGELFGTIILFIGVSSIYAEAGSGLGPFLVGMLVWVIGSALGGTTGYAINPARDLAPRIAHFLLPIQNKRDSNWAYAWLPVVAPIIGAVLASFLF